MAMASVTIRLEDEKRDELERLARQRGSTVSDMLRIAIDGLLRRDVPLTLDMVARRSLALSHEILAHLDPDPDAQQAHRRSIRVLSGGYTSEYPREFYSIDTESSLDDGGLVMDVLDMFAADDTSIGVLPLARFNFCNCDFSVAASTASTFDKATISGLSVRSPP